MLWVVTSSSSSSSSLNPSWKSMRASGVGESKGKMNVLRSNAGTPHAELQPQIFYREEQSWISVCFPFLKHQIKKKLFPYGFILKQEKKEQFVRKNKTTPASRDLNLPRGWRLNFDINWNVSLVILTFIPVPMFLSWKKVDCFTTEM